MIRTLGLFISIQRPKSEACGLLSTICDFEEEIGEALITMKALLLYRPGEACGLLESIFQPIVQACGSFRLVVTTFGSRE